MPYKAFANPPVPFVAPVLIRKSLVENPRIPLVLNVAIVQLVVVKGLKFAAAPLVRGFVPERLQRLILKKLVELSWVRFRVPVIVNES